MSGKIQLTPEELKSQSAEMSALNEEMTTLFGGISREMNTVNSNWSPNLANNFSGKINCVNTSFSDLSAMFGFGAEAARTSAETMETVDATLGKMMFGGDGSFGGGEGGGGFRGNDEKGFWAEQWDQLKHDWNSLGEGWEWAEEKYNELPEWARKDIENALGGDIKAAITITGDIITNNISFDTLETYLSSIGSENAGVITSVLKTVICPSDNMKTLLDGIDLYRDLGTDALADGNIGEGLKDLGMSLVSGFCAIGYGIGDVASEAISGLFNEVGGMESSILDVVGRVVQGETGDFLTNLSSGVASTTESVAKWFSNLL